MPLLDSYLARIGHDGPVDSSFGCLGVLQAAHVAAIPFENLNPLMGLPVSLAPDDLWAKLVMGRRGGYCFEQNGVFRRVLEELGFMVTGLCARVMWNAPPDAPLGPLTHMLVRVDMADGPWIADVGFGGWTLPAPYRLTPDVEQPMSGTVVRLIEADGAFTLQFKAEGEWRNIYRFTTEPRPPMDYVVGSWYTATHPESLFRNNLLMERLTPSARISLFNRELTRRFPDGAVEKTTVDTAAGLAEVLADVFSIDCPVAVKDVFARLPSLSG